MATEALRVRCRTQRRKAVRAAEGMHLVHVTARQDSGNFIDVVLGSSDVVPIGNSGGEVATEAERMFKLGRSLYLYAGRAHPRKGTVGLVFRAGCESSYAGGATPFDTGGIADRRISTAEMDDCSLKALVSRYLFPLSVWRKWFARFLCTYFSPLGSYWSERPTVVGSVEPRLEDLFRPHRGNAWYAWTAEVHLRKGIELAYVDAWCATPEFMEALDRLLIDGPPPEAASPAVRRLFVERPPLSENGTPDFHVVIESWIRGQLAL